MHLNYSKQRVLLHWLSAAVILWALASGFYVAYGPVSDSVEHWVGSINVSLTTLFIPLFAWRFCLFACEFDAHEAKSSWAKALALLVHLMIYLTIAAVLVTGVLMMKKTISVFGLVHIPQPLQDPSLIEWATMGHIQSCAVLSLLVALHLCAVAWHEFSGRRVLQRMSFARPAGEMNR
ncbi:cytochrome b/b6 domain-containing protein [Pseudomonas sp. T1.Ur]|uniref:cytochrome b n=1 Tax=Pseudomonas sp. T1.Ur TaxID=2928704 RepID=UPI00201D53C4|nr:cytochrome b/b6 domain-containing protein [Pseudomonas sp. T1.Ur]MCL6704250.1 cytochrome b/b6 domain-containing protein [Pseudomonas sp. T1.Ur]